MDTKPTELPVHFYSFYNSRVHIYVKAHNQADAIEWLKIIFGEHWVKSNINEFEISCF